MAILKPNGYFIALVPRRSGLWTRYDNNPFGHGRSYSTTQFKRLIEDYLILDQKKSFLHFLGIIMLIINSIELLKQQVIVFFLYGRFDDLCCKKIVYATNKSKSKKIPIKI